MKKKKIIFPKFSFKYKELIDKLQAKLRSGELTEQQKVRIFFFVKSEEIKNMTKNDLMRAQKRYEKIEKAILRTIPYLQVQLDKARRARKQHKLQDRIKAEKYTLRQCKSLVAKIKVMKRKR